MKIALANGVFGEKMMIDSIYNCLVNDQGELRHINTDTSHTMFNTNGAK